MTNVIRIVSAVVDVHELTLYKHDGTKITIPQGDPRIRQLVDKVVPAIDAQKFCELTDADFSIVGHYAEAEKQLGGVAKFFRVLKSKVKEVVAKFSAPVEPLAVGQIPKKEETKTWAELGKPVEQVTAEDLEAQAPLSRSAEAVAEIMQHAAPSHSPEFHAPDAGGEETTVIAIMEDNTIIPNIEDISDQIKHLAEGLGNPVGVANFFKRLASVKRNHSAADLLKFMKSSELPIADDGTVLVYKNLNKADENGLFKDCHSGKVMQRLGSFVFMHERLVDPDRRRDCSNGLHIATRSYLRSFGGAVTVLCKLAPEDVIAVPEYNHNKLRARAYHIIAVLSREDASRVCSNQPLTDTHLLGNALAGNHVGVLELVEITAGYGGGLIIKPGPDATAPAHEMLDVHASSLDESLSKEEERQGSEVDAAALAKGRSVAFAGDRLAVLEELEEGKHLDGAELQELDELRAAAPAKAKPATKLDLLKADYNNASTEEESKSASEALLHYKKSAKKSWDALGITPAQVADILDQTGIADIAASVKAQKAEKAVVPKATRNIGPITKQAKANVSSAKGSIKAQGLKPAKFGKLTVGAPFHQIQEILLDSKSKPTVAQAHQMLAIKQKAKKAWSYFLTPEQEEVILKLLK